MFTRLKICPERANKQLFLMNICQYKYSCSSTPKSHLPTACFKCRYSIRSQVQLLYVSFSFSSNSQEAEARYGVYPGSVYWYFHYDFLPVGMSNPLHFCSFLNVSYDDGYTKYHSLHLCACVCASVFSMCALFKWHKGQMWQKILVYFSGYSSKVYVSIYSVFQGLKCIYMQMPDNNRLYVPVRLTPTCCRMSLCTVWMCVCACHTHDCWPVIGYTTYLIFYYHQKIIVV